MDSNGTHFAVPKPCGVYSSCELKASLERPLNLELLLGSCEWCRPSSLGKQADG